jgi:hypothetical protein
MKKLITMDDQRCGNCGWWGDNIATTDEGRQIAKCTAPVPSCVIDPIRMWWLDDVLGRDCPCWKGKEDE